MTARDALQPITLTAIVGGILYCRGASDHFVFEGSYEINPFYQRDIDALRAWSPRFLTMLTVNVLFLWTVWSWSISDFDSGLYLIVLGSLLLTELVVHIRHVRNWFLFRTIIRLAGIRDASNTLDASCWRCRRSRSSRLPGCLRSSSSSPVCPLQSGNFGSMRRTRQCSWCRHSSVSGIATLKND